MKKPKLASSVVIIKLQEFFIGRDADTICADLGISTIELHALIREYGEIASELIELKDENEKLRTMFTNLSLVNQSLRSSLDSVTRTNPAMFDFLIKKRLKCN
ncbi:hypothetical protein ACJVDH_02400 [Pedobacter sp. AW1-32]|uniref:hypothetical protein n=1 Tax=Pedobacter sp. AW1-32 TaxID=3383026 RepID=UPI003FF0FE07